MQNISSRAAGVTGNRVASGAGNRSGWEESISLFILLYLLKLNYVNVKKILMSNVKIFSCIKFSVLVFFKIT